MADRSAADVQPKRRSLRHSGGDDGQMASSSVVDDEPLTVDEEDETMAAARRAKVQVLEGATFTKDPTQITYIIHEEDHTLGNALKHVISGYKEVEFCGYSIPHPLEDKILFRIQTTAGHNAADVMRKGLLDVKTVYATIREKFEKAVKQEELKNRETVRIE